VNGSKQLPTAHHTVKESSPQVAPERSAQAFNRILIFLADKLALAQAF
jgi:hypothetical protein